MEANRSHARWTYAEFARLPTSGSRRSEIIDDELTVTPAPGTRHQRVSMSLATRMNVFIEAHGLGELFAAPFDVLFAEGDFLEPDLVVEILSPSTAHRDRGVKLDRYRLYDVPEYWVVDPEARAIEVWHLARGASAPEVVASGGILRWTPMPDGPTLELDAAEVLPEE